MGLSVRKNRSLYNIRIHAQYFKAYLTNVINTTVKVQLGFSKVQSSLVKTSNKARKVTAQEEGKERGRTKVVAVALQQNRSKKQEFASEAWLEI